MLLLCRCWSLSLSTRTNILSHTFPHSLPSLLPPPLPVLVGNLRKAGTIALSFLVFPKPFSWYYVWGTVLVFGGLTITAYVKDQKRR